MSQFAGDTIEACNENHLLQLAGCLGTLPADLLSRWPSAETYFHPDGTLYRSKTSGPEAAVTFEPLEKYFARNKPPNMDTEEEKVILLLLRSIFQYDPAARPSATELLSHPWFNEAAESKLRS